MKIIVAAIGKLKKQSPELAIIQEYVKQISWPIQFIELEPKKKIADIKVQKAYEAQVLLSAIPKGHYLIILDEKGRSDLSSVQFADLLEKLNAQNKKKIAFIIGGANGVDKNLIDQGDLVLSLGRLTMPHLLARVVLVEQIYRAMTILDKHPYHK